MTADLSQHSVRVTVVCVGVVLVTVGDGLMRVRMPVSRAGRHGSVVLVLVVLVVRMPVLVDDGLV